MSLSIALFPIIIIYLVLAIRIVKRGKDLGDKDLASLIFIGAIGAIVVLAPQDLSLFYRILLALGIVVSCLGFWFWVKNAKPQNPKSPSPNVYVHYPFTNVTDDNYHKQIPDYISNNRTWDAYLLSKDTLQRCVREKRVADWVSYPSVKAMKSKLEQQYTVHNKEATLQDLDIILKGDHRSLMFVPNPISDAEMAKLIERKNAGAFKDLELVFIHSWHHVSDKKKKENYPTNRRILIDHSKRTARPPPIGDLWMWHAGIFKEKQYRKIIPCTLGFWCFFFEITKFFPKVIRYKKKQQYDISELLAEEKQVTDKTLV